jgi:cytochrome b561
VSTVSSRSGPPILTYTRTAIALHWIVAALFLASYVSVYYRRWFTEPKTPENLTALQIHIAVGLSIAAFVALRVFWRWRNPPPPDLPAPDWQHRAAHAVHMALYAFMIMMPITGYLGTGVASDYLGIPKFEDTWLFQAVIADGLGLTFKEFEVPMDFLHKNSGAYVLWVIIAAHVAAALYHHGVLRDATLRRMTG